MPELVQLTRTVFRKTVRSVGSSPVKSTGLFALKTAAGNAKLGNGRNVFTKGRFRGMPLFSLTLEERATCPSSCAQWTRCYGNRMVYATRYNVDEALYAGLRADVAKLSLKYPHGFVTRLHVLGDMVSVAYVEFWRELLEQHPELHIFGYTHREHGTPIGDAVAALVHDFPERVSILRSDGADPADPLPKAVVIDAHATVPAPLTKVICPEQTGKAASCLECGLCTLGTVGVSFLNHGREARPAQPAKQAA